MGDRKEDVLIPKDEPERPYYVTNRNHFEEMVMNDEIDFDESGRFLYKGLRIVPIAGNPWFAKIRE